MKFRDEVEIAFDDSGAGEAVLLLHGHPFNRSMWQAQTAALQSNFRVVAPDLRGYGETPVHGDISSLNEMANDLIRLLDYLKLETVVLGGLSMGGYVAFEFYDQFPERVSALVLADTKPGADVEEARQKRYQTADKAQIEGMNSIVEEMLSKVLAKETFEKQPETIERVRQMMLSTNPNGAAAGLRGMAERRDHTALLSKITIPTLIIVGEEDSLTPPAEAEKMREAIKNSQLVRIRGASHLTAIEKPEEFNRALLEFLKSL